VLATIESVTIIDEAEDLGRMILESEIANAYRQALKDMQSNIETQEKIKRFSHMKELFEEVQRFGKYHPDYKRANIEIRTLKRDMDMDLYVATFRQTENDLQQVLDDVSAIIGSSVSVNIKVPSGNSFFESASSCSTGGGCGTGGGCSCSA
jgi:cell fate (sporulation/competence/biofilm development) regulator YlbF (YheA/YmcA/DUF963 family)